MGSEWDLVLLGCGRRKVDHAARLIDLYTGPAYRSHRSILEHVAGRVDGILSALHGWASPTMRARPYDRTLNRRTSLAWSDRVLADLLAWQEASGLPRPRILVLAGALYVDGWADRVRAHGWAVDDPLRRLPLGKRRALAGAVLRDLRRAASREEFLTFVARWRLLDHVLPMWRAALPAAHARHLEHFLATRPPAVAAILDTHLARGQ